MKIAVFVKQVEDARTVRIDSESGAASTTGDRVMNPADAIAVSESIDLREAVGGEVTAVTLGPSGAREVVVEALATGADAGIHVVVEDAANGDSLAVANALADAVRDKGFDIYFAGDATNDYGTGQVGAQVAEALGIPHVMKVLGISQEGDVLKVQRDLDGFPEEIEVPTPVVLVVAPSDEGPKRHASLRGMMQAKRKTVEEIITEAGMFTALEWSGSRAQRTSADRIMLQGEPAEEMAAKLAAWLRENRLVG
jgi:electron transfer flavoprotein beta subunit